MVAMTKRNYVPIVSHFLNNALRNFHLRNKDSQITNYSNRRTAITVSIDNILCCGKDLSTSPSFSHIIRLLEALGNKP